MSRRRVLTITAAAGGLGLLPLARAGAAPFARKPQVWRGTALGAEARITLYHPDSAVAAALLDQARAEIARLERVFSLYRQDSALSQLNRDGEIAAPPLDLVRLLAEAGRFGGLTDGAFDATVQPLWELYAAHFQAADADPGGPPPAAIAAALARVDYRAVAVDSARIAFRKPGMAATLNGIAQGYITDRVAALLRQGGIERVLIDLGELRGLGDHPDGRPWRVGIRDPRRDDALLESVDLEDRAIATSAGWGTRFDAAGRHHHLFDPRTGVSAERYDSVSVIARDATTADALSTAFMAMPAARIAGVIGQDASASAIAYTATGERLTFGASRG
jgi:thiamine biosynthesis lipoprotein